MALRLCGLPATAIWAIERKGLPERHQHILVADGDAIQFYSRMGFERWGRTESMWIYAGRDH
jgi:hypothetical protein